MATIRANERTITLESDYTIGRSVRSGLCIADRRVSSQHAVIRWTGVSWEVKDLGSRNGTFVDGERLKRGEGSPIRKGATLAFGNQNERWELMDDSPPAAMMVPLNGGEPIYLEHDLLALPSAEDPQFTVYCGADGNWFVEGEGMSSPITLQSRQQIDLGGNIWRFSAPEQIWQTSLSDDPAWEIGAIRLRFTVSRDEEHVQVTLLAGDEYVDLDPRTRHYLLLTLARRRLEDSEQGLPEAECGWVNHEDLAHDPSMAGSQLNIDVFRIRGEFARMNVLGAAKIIERRPRAKQLRIGTGRIDISRI